MHKIPSAYPTNLHTANLNRLIFLSQFEKIKYFIDSNI